LDYQQLLVEHLTGVDKLVRFVARRHHLSRADEEEFASIVRLKLVDRDFAILRKFQGRSSITTYLAIVIERLCLDFLVAKWGKWRPSAAARRLGAVAILLEQMLVRDGITFEEAVGTLQTNHGVSQTRAELHAVLLQLPRHLAGSTRPASPVVTTNPSLENHEDVHAVERVQAALRAAIDAVPREDRHLLELRFERGLTVAQIARQLGIDGKRLYRHMNQIMGVLRSEMQQRGIEEAEIARVIGHPTLTLRPLLIDGRR
jgi:RNA polymerase sigma factor (sigma-70 family)